jgi:hypothetical protein
MYNVPGFADEVSDEIRTRWNELIKKNYESLQADGWGSKYFVLDSQDVINGSENNIIWFADPAEPTFCISEEVAQKLSDWGVRGRQELQNEYCEYVNIYRNDTNGKLRLKRVQITTELREYWVCIATYDPKFLREMVNNILGIQVDWRDLYGVDDPLVLNERDRKREFCRFVAGQGYDNDPDLSDIPVYPIGKLNRDNALFMIHPINGLDDLLYIVMFGSKPYAVNRNGNFQKASREQIFKSFGVEHLACRHADPAAAMGAYGAVFEGRKVSFQNPLGVYITAFNRDAFSIQNQPLPESWIRFSRGGSLGSHSTKLWQRLEFGPSDDEPSFLDDVRISVGGTENPLLGGFQILQQIEVGPFVLIGDSTTIPSNEYYVLEDNSESIICSEADACERINRLKLEYEQSLPFTRLGPRRIGRL